MCPESNSDPQVRGGLHAAPAGRSVAEDVVAVLVGQALDDMAAERVDVAGALALVGTIAWRQGHDFANDRISRIASAPGSPPVSSDADGDYIVLVADAATGEVDAEGPFTGVEAMDVADQVRLELDASGLSEFTVTLTRLRRPR